MSNDEESFLERWSRLKRERAKGSTGPVAAAREAHASAAETAAEPVAAEPERDAAGSSTVSHGSAGDAQAEPFDLSKLPRIDELTAQSDIRGFLDKRVPAALRNAALRQMWTLDPNIRDFIEVADYQWDWNTPGGAQGYELIDAAKTDIASLLAQATGAVQRAVTPTTGDDHEMLSEEKSTPTMAAGIDPPQGPEPSALHNPPTTIDRGGQPGSDENTSAMIEFQSLPAAHPSRAIDAAAQQSERSETKEPVPMGRRHGGALPL